MQVASLNEVQTYVLNSLTIAHFFFGTTLQNSETNKNQTRNTQHGERSTYKNKKKSYKKAFECKIFIEVNSRTHSARMFGYDGQHLQG